MVHTPDVEPPDLRQLQQGDADAWDAAFRWLWPVAFEAARLKLFAFLPADVEDVAIESLEELVEKVRALKQVDELRPLVASIAHHRAVSRLREHFAVKRGAGQTTSLQGMSKDDGEPFETSGGESPLARLDENELASVLRELQAELKPEQRAVLEDFFEKGLSYEEIARKHGIALGSVGVYLKRGLDAMKRLGVRQPQLMKELEAFLR